MKLLASLVVLLAATMAQATPTVGDIADFSGTTDHAGQTYPVQITLQIMAFDATTQIYTQQTTMAIGPKTQTKTEQVAAADMITDATIDAVLADCVGQGGTPETIAVPAGNFETCKIKTDGGDLYNIAKVPFGVAKMTSATMNLSLVSFVNGK